MEIIGLASQLIGMVFIFTSMFFAFKNEFYPATVLAYLAFSFTSFSIYFY